MPLIHLLLLLVGFVLLVYGADKLVEGASALARRYNIPDIVIGLTIVALGTSAPEMAINIVAAIKGNTDLVLGNVLGSNIFNVLAILGISALIAPLAVKKNTIRYEIPFSLLAGLAVLFLASDNIFNPGDNFIERKDGFILVIFFILFLAYNFHLVKSHPEELEIAGKTLPLVKTLLYIFFGLAGLVFGGKLIVDHAISLATILGISERVIALTIVSVGTSLPELATSIVAVRKKEVDIAIGNVVGSNIFNIFFVLGISTIAKQTPVPPNSFIDIWVNIAAGLMLLIFAFRGKASTGGRWEGRQLDFREGLLFIIMYIAYIAFLLFSKGQ